ncbi:unnamed protein product [Gadus morhua 'NCC']
MEYAWYLAMEAPFNFTVKDMQSSENCGAQYCLRTSNWMGTAEGSHTSWRRPNKWRLTTSTSLQTEAKKRMSWS